MKGGRWKSCTAKSNAMAARVFLGKGQSKRDFLNVNHIEAVKETNCC